MANYDVTTDGRRFMMVRSAGEEGQQLTVVLDWFEELTRLVPVPGRN
jgi:hypothetical protein